ncbi:hypothetical protein [Streptomyces sp. NPDC093094]|uniref:hypothetical protein n=1 Tax=Streptomyces sp. NPDC093094 TaxID=3366026 RepID=UPI0038143CBE
MTDSWRPGRSSAAAMTLADAERTVTEARQKAFRAEQATVEALGIDPQTLYRQAAADAAEAEADHPLMDALRRRAAAATAAELPTILEEARVLLTRAQARRRRRQEHQRVLDRIAEAWAAVTG